MNGTRLKYARLSNSLSLQDLSDILNESGTPITRAGLSKYETDKVVPNESILAEIAKITDLDISFFHKDHFPSYQINPAMKYQSIPKLEAEFNAFLQITLEQHFEIDELLGISETTSLPDKFPIQEGEEEKVCAFAQTLREQWGIKSQPISSVVSLLEDQGFYVFRIPDNFDIPGAAGIVTDFQKPFLAYTRSEFIDDTRFFLLTQLGYFFFDNESPDLLAHMCRVFARAMLMPKQSLIHDIGTVYEEPTFWELTLLKQKYGISKVEIRRRIRDIGLLTIDPTMETLRKKNYISARRKLDSSRDILNFSETPVHFKLKVLLAYKKKLISRSLAASLLPKQYIQMNSWDS